MNPFALLLALLMIVESNGNSRAVGDGGSALGCLQIRPAVVADVNRVYGTAFRHRDAFGREEAKTIACLYLSHWGKQYKADTGEAPSMETLARIWNGGPYGYADDATLAYWAKVRRAAAELRERRQRALATRGGRG